MTVWSIFWRVEYLSNSTHHNKNNNKLIEAVIVGIQASSNAWTMYWQADNLNSFIANNAQSDTDIFIEIWRNFLKTQPTHASILDLATGNGAVPATLLKINSNLDITGVDQANISPTDYLRTEQALDKVNFVGNTDISRLPFPDNYFDGVTSQFGFEYADKDSATAEFVRVLKPNHSFQLVIHHSSSDLVQHSKSIMKELSLVLEEQGLVYKLSALIKNHISSSDLETYYKQFLVKHDGKLTERISGQIFNFAEELIHNIRNGATTLPFLPTVTNLTRRISNELERLTQLTNAALSQNEIQTMCKQLQSVCSDVKFEPILIEDPLHDSIIAWSVSGSK